MAQTGWWFDFGSVAGEDIKVDADDSGLRLTFLVTSRAPGVSRQIDVGFGDVVTPTETKADYPVLLDFAARSWATPVRRSWQNSSRR